MSWNYRVCKTTTTGVHPNGDEWSNICYAIHEAYYNSAREIWAVTENPISVLTDTSPGQYQETEEECVITIEKMLGMMLAAASKPVVDLDNIVYADQDGIDDE